MPLIIIQILFQQCKCTKCSTTSQIWLKYSFGRAKVGDFKIWSKSKWPEMKIDILATILTQILLVYGCVMYINIVFLQKFLLLIGMFFLEGVHVVPLYAQMDGGGEYLILLSCVKTSKVNASFKSFFFSSSFFVFQEQQIKLPITLPIASTGQSLFHQLRSEMPHRIEVSGGNLWPTASQPNSDDDEIKLHLTANPNSMPSRRLSLPTIMHTTGGWMKTVKQLEI